MLRTGKQARMFSYREVVHGEGRGPHNGRCTTYLVQNSMTVRYYTVPTPIRVRVVEEARLYRTNIFRDRIILRVDARRDYATFLAICFNRRSASLLNGASGL